MKLSRFSLITDDQMVDHMVMVWPMFQHTLRKLGTLLAISGLRAIELLAAWRSDSWGTLLCFSPLKSTGKAMIHSNFLDDS